MSPTLEDFNWKPLVSTKTDISEREEALRLRLDLFVKKFVSHVEKEIECWRGTGSKEITEATKVTSFQFPIPPIISLEDIKVPTIGIKAWLASLPLKTQRLILIEVAGFIFITYEQPLMSAKGIDGELSWSLGVNLLAKTAADNFLSISASTAEFNESVKNLQHSIDRKLLQDNILFTLVLRQLKNIQCTSHMSNQTVNINGEAVTTSDVYAKAGVVKVNEKCNEIVGGKVESTTGGCCRGNRSKD